MNVKILSRDVEWMLCEGMTQGFVDLDGVTYEINISARVPRDVKWGESGTNERTWTVEVYGEQHWFAEGEAEGLRASKTAALAAPNDYCNRTPQ